MFENATGSNAKPELGVADADRAQGIMRFCMWMTFVYGLLFGAIAAYLQSIVLAEVAATTFTAGFGYEIGRRLR